MSVDVNARLINDLNHLPIKAVNGAMIYLSDVAQVHDGYTPQQNAVRQDGVRGALLTVMKAGRPPPWTWCATSRPSCRR